MIWVEDPGMDALLLAGLEDEGVDVRHADFRDQLLGAVVYDLGTASSSVATSLCGPMQAAAADTSLLAAAGDAGLPVLADVRRHEDHSPYNAKDGRLFWHDGKPCVSYRYLLWESKRANAP